MSNVAIYSKSQTLRGNVDASKLQQEVEATSIVKNVKNIVLMETEIAIVFDENLEPSDIAILDSVIENHNFLSPQQEVQIIVGNAISFGQQLIVEFASENVLMGITQAGKTRDVADYLSNLMRYAQSGSLYEVINEVDRLIAEGLPSSLEPFITETRMNSFKQKVVDYLS